MKVTPHSKKSGNGSKGDVKITKLGKDRKPSHTRRISLGNKDRNARLKDGLDDSYVTDHHATEIEIMANQSDLSSVAGNRNVPLPSDVSSMPPDSTIAGPPVIVAPQRRERSRSRSRSLERVGEGERNIDAAPVTLHAPVIGRSRSKSKERITQKAIEKLTRDQDLEKVTASKRHSNKSRPKSSGTDASEDLLKARSRRSSKSHRDSEFRSGTDSSLLPVRDQESNISSGSKVSLTNPKLLQTVEDAIRRLILPEIETLKRNQSVRSTKTRDSYTSEDSVSRSGTGHRHSKTISEERSGKPKVVLNNDSRDAGEPLAEGSHRKKKHRRSRRDSTSDNSSRRESIDSITKEKERIRKSKDKTSTKKRDIGEGGLTKAALRDHNSRSRERERQEERDELREKRKQRSKSQSRSNSIVRTEDEYYEGKDSIPPLPLNSTIQDSEMTRDSLLSAESNYTQGTGSATPESPARTAPAVREVARSSPRAVTSPVSRSSAKTPTGTREAGSPRAVRSRGDMSLKSARSDRSISGKAKVAALAAAGLGGAAGGLYGHDRRRDTERRSSKEKRVSSRDQSPSLSGSKSKGEVPDTSSPITERRITAPSRDSVMSSPGVDYPLTKKRHEAINMSNTDIIDSRIDNKNDRDVQDEDMDDEFYEKQRKLNNEYRSSWEYDSQRDSVDVAGLKGHAPRQSQDETSLLTSGQQLRDVGANAQVFGTPHDAESAVASLVGDSTVSSQQGPSAQEPHDLTHKPDIDHLDKTRDLQVQGAPTDAQREYITEHDNASAERWNAIRGHAQKLSDASNSSPDRSPNRGDQRAISQGRVTLGASSVPIANDPLPEADYMQDDVSDLTQHGRLDRRQSSVIEGPLGDEYENQGLWPYEPTPDINRRDGFVMPDDRSVGSMAEEEARMMNNGAGLGIGGAAGPSRGAQSDTYEREPVESSASSRDGRYDNRNAAGRQTYAERQVREPSMNKDEGYISAAPARSIDGGTPLSFSKPPPKLFDENRRDVYDPALEQPSPYPEDKHQRHFSGNSHGMPAEAYDAATGTGIDHIQSKDVVALMDHLTVRDGHRNARDTEILVTLVRSAAEMRTSLDDMKKFIEMQNVTNMKRSDQTAEKTINKILGASRPATTASPHGMRSAASASDRDDVPVKKKNIFQRALKGLGSRNEKDIGKLEDMLLQLLDEVEGLREAQAGGSTRRPSAAEQRGSLDSYERLRAAPESSGYEPEGQAGTSSTPNISGTFSPNSKSAQRMHSGYRDSGNRISTVMEGDEDAAANGYENDDGMLTPTQETHAQRYSDFNTPSTAARNSQNVQATPKSADRKNRQQSTSSSMFGGIPKISRWSKTTTSSAAPGRDSFQHDRPYSEASRSGSQINVLPGGGIDEAPYQTSADDRLRSADSFARVAEGNLTPGRTPSPPQGMPPDLRPMSMDDPKYQANRQSLTLQHPQPRQGPTHRHQSHLESQAHTFAGPAGSRMAVQGPGGKQVQQQQQAPQQSYDRRQPVSPESPQADVFGSVPGLSRNRLSVPQSDSRRTSGNSENRNVSPLSSETGYAPPRPPKVRDDRPIVPAKVPLDHGDYDNTPHGSSDSEGAHRGGPGNGDGAADTPPHVRIERAARYAWDKDGGEYTPSLASSSDAAPFSPSTHLHPPHPDARHHADKDDDHYSSGEDRDSLSPSDEEDPYPPPIPLARPRSPYSPGGLLAPIEERYSLEQSRISSPMSRRDTVGSRRSVAVSSGHNSAGDVEARERDVVTPTASPRPAVLAGGDGAGAGGSVGRRKITGPREMPGSPSGAARVGSGGSLGGMRRKPVAGNASGVTTF